MLKRGKWACVQHYYIRPVLVDVEWACIHYVQSTSSRSARASTLRQTLVLPTSGYGGFERTPIRTRRTYDVHQIKTYKSFTSKTLRQKIKWVQQHFPATTLGPSKNDRRPSGPLQPWRASNARPPRWS